MPSIPAVTCGCQAHNLLYQERQSQWEHRDSLPQQAVSSGCGEPGHRERTRLSPVASLAAGQKLTSTNQQLRRGGISERRGLVTGSCQMPRYREMHH